MQSLKIDYEKGKEVAKLLYECFSTTGILGFTEMPEDLIPYGVEQGSLEHLLFLTLTVAIDYQRDANKLWAASRLSYEEPEIRYLYNPESLHKTPFKKIVHDMQKYGLSKKPKKDAEIWRTVGVTFYKKWDGNPLKFLKDCGWDSVAILRRLKNDVHLYNGRLVSDFPFLRGDKIGPLWIRVLRDNVGLTELRKLEHVPIPVDIHIARATLTTRVVYGKYSGGLVDMYEYIRRAWSLSVRELNVKDQAMIALDVDEPLWHLSKYGCSKRDKNDGYCPAFHRCEAKDFCVKGRIKIKNSHVDLDT